MRPITKILLLIVVAFFVYLLWPRNPTLTEFTPTELARLEMRAWQAEADGGFGAMIPLFRIYAFHYGVAPLASFQIASAETGAVSVLRKFAGDPDGLGPSRALVPLQEKYVILRRQTGRDFDSDACARGEISWREIELEGGKPEAVATAMASCYAAFFGGESGDYLATARNLAGARALLFGAKLPEGYSDRERAALELATDGYRELHASLAARGGASD